MATDRPLTDLDELAHTIKAGDELCFGCGRENPIGLSVGGFVRDGDRLTAGFDPSERHRGFRGIMHGGILATALDEMLAWTAILVERVMVVTGTLELRYRRPAPMDEPYVLEGWVDDRRGRRLRMAGRALVDGTVVAEAGGLFIVTDTLPTEI